MKREFLITVILSAFVSAAVTSAMFSRLSKNSLAEPAVFTSAAPPAVAARPERLGCVQDEGRFCAEKINADERDACLQDHFSEVSADCRKDLEKSRFAIKACEGAIKSFCKDAGYGGGRMKRCLAAHLDGLGFECRAALGLPPK